MRTVAEYRTHADKCRELANLITIPVDKKILEEMAQSWGFSRSPGQFRFCFFNAACRGLGAGSRCRPYASFLSLQRYGCASSPTRLRLPPSRSLRAFIRCS